MFAKASSEHAVPLSYATDPYRNVKSLAFKENVLSRIDFASLERARAKLDSERAILALLYRRLTSSGALLTGQAKLTRERRTELEREQAKTQQDIRALSQSISRGAENPHHESAWNSPEISDVPW